MPVKFAFNVNCKKCKRLNKHLKQVKKDFPEYYCKPVAAFGDDNTRLLVVGLAPGLHGANATGRPFTGDASGEMLFKALYKFGFSSSDKAVSVDDGLILNHCKITNVVKCLPPQNKPITDEINTCNKYLSVEFSKLDNNTVILILGSVAHQAVLKALDLKRSDFPFAHMAEYNVKTKQGQYQLLSSYHCSRYNTQTKRLTSEMFENVFIRAKELITNDR